MNLVTREQAERYAHRVGWKNYIQGSVVVALTLRIAQDWNGLEGHIQWMRDSWQPLGSFWNVFWYVVLGLLLIWGSLSTRRPWEAR